MQAHRDAAALSLIFVLAIACTPAHPDALDELGGEISTDTTSSTTGPADATSSDTGEPCTSESTSSDTSGETSAACCDCSIPVECWQWSEGPEACEALGAGLGVEVAWCELDVFGSASDCFAQCAEPAETSDTGDASLCCSCSTLTCEEFFGTATECEAWSGGAQLYVWCDPSLPVGVCWAQCG